MNLLQTYLNLFRNKNLDGDCKIYMKINKHIKTNKTKSLREKAELSTFKVNKLHSERKSISKEPNNVFHSRTY